MTVRIQKPSWARTSPDDTHYTLEESRALEATVDRLYPYVPQALDSDELPPLRVIPMVPPSTGAKVSSRGKHYACQTCGGDVPNGFVYYCSARCAQRMADDLKGAIRPAPAGTCSFCGDPTNHPTRRCCSMTCDRKWDRLRKRHKQALAERDLLIERGGVTAQEATAC